jgi:hypothetical protein
MRSAMQRAIRGCAWSLCLAALVVGAARVALAEGLAEIVSADVGICIEGRDVPTKLRAFFQGPIGKRLLAHHTVVSWRSQKADDLKQFKSDLESHFQMPFAELCDGVAGREILLGVWPEATPDAGDSPALLLLHARDAKTMERAFQALYDEQQKAGRVRPDVEVTIDGAPRTLRVIAPEKEKELLFLATDGDVGLLCNSQKIAIDALRRIVARGKSSVESASTDSLAALPSYQSAMSQLPTDAVATMFVNARAWDQTLVDAVEKDADEDELSPEDREKLLSSWRATGYLAGGVALGDEIHAEGVWQVDQKQLPVAARELADAVSGHAGFLEFVPNDALIAVSGRAQWGRLARIVWSELALGDRDSDESASAAAAADVLLQLLEKLGPDCGAFVSAAPTKGEDKLPVELAFGLETRSRLPRELASTATDTVDQSLRSALAMVTVFYNQNRDNGKADLRMERVDGVPMTTLTGISELGEVQPTYTMTANGVLVGTSRDAVAAAVAIKPADSLARSERVTRVLVDAWSSPSQVFYLDARGLRALIQSHAGFAHHFSKRSGATPELAKRGLDELAQFLALGDTLVGAARVEPDGVSVLLHASAD